MMCLIYIIYVLLWYVKLELFKIIMCYEILNVFICDRCVFVFVIFFYDI